MCLKKNIGIIAVEKQNAYNVFQRKHQNYLHDGINPSNVSKENSVLSHNEIKSLQYFLREACISSVSE